MGAGVFARVVAVPGKFVTVARGWYRHLRDDVAAASGYRVVLRVLITFAAAWLSLFTIESSEHSYDADRAEADGNRIIELASSGNVGFVSAMSQFSTVQTVSVRNAPNLFGLYWWRSSDSPNEAKLHDWAKDYFNRCVPERCGVGDYRIVLDADLSNAVLSDVNFSKSDLSDVDLSSASLNGVNLSQSNVSSARLYCAVLRNAGLSDADFSETDLTGANLVDADLSNANLFRTILSNADLQDADLQGANLAGAVLANTDLRGANLSRVVYLRSEQLEQAYWDGNTEWPNRFTPPEDERVPESAADDPCDSEEQPPEL